MLACSETDIKTLRQKSFICRFLKDKPSMYGRTSATTLYRDWKKPFRAIQVLGSLCSAGKGARELNQGYNPGSVALTQLQLPRQNQMSHLCHTESYLWFSWLLNFIQSGLHLRYMNPMLQHVATELWILIRQIRALFAGSTHDCAGFRHVLLV